MSYFRTVNELKFIRLFIKSALRISSFEETLQNEKWFVEDKKQTQEEKKSTSAEFQEFEKPALAKPLASWLVKNVYAVWRERERE